MFDIEIHSSRGHCDHRDRGEPTGAVQALAWLGGIFVLALVAMAVWGDCGLATANHAASFDHEAGQAAQPIQAAPQLIYWDVNYPECKHAGNANKALECAKAHAAQW